MNSSSLTFQRWEVLAERRGKLPNSNEDVLIYHRVVGLRYLNDGTLKYLALLDLTDKGSVPTIVPRADLESLLREGRWVKSSFDPCVPKIRCPKKLNRQSAEPQR